MSKFDSTIHLLDGLFYQVLTGLNQAEILSAHYESRLSAKDHRSMIEIEKRYLKNEEQQVRNVFMAKEERVRAEETLKLCQANELNVLCESIKSLEAINATKMGEVDVFLKEIDSRNNAKPMESITAEFKTMDVTKPAVMENKLFSKPQLPLFDDIKISSGCMYSSSMEAQNVGCKVKQTGRLLQQTSANGSYLADDCDEDIAPPKPSHFKPPELDLDMDNSVTQTFGVYSTALKPSKPNIFDDNFDENACSDTKQNPVAGSVDTNFLSNPFLLKKPKLPDMDGFEWNHLNSPRYQKVGCKVGSAFQPLQDKNDGFVKPKVPAAKMQDAMKKLRRSIDTNPCSSAKDTTYSFKQHETTVHLNHTIQDKHQFIDLVTQEEYGGLVPSSKEKLSFHQLNFAVVSLNKLFDKKGGGCGLKRSDLQRYLQASAALDPVEAMLTLSVLSDFGKLRRFKTAQPSKQDITIFATE